MKGWGNQPPPSLPLGTITKEKKTKRNNYKYQNILFVYITVLCSFDFFSKKCIIKHRGMDFLETFNGLRFLSFISFIPPPPFFSSFLF